jgi:ParB/RepB/Spo0J family partition protein
MSSTFESMLTASREREGELRLIHILIARLEPDPDQPRKSINPLALAELAASIRQDGVLHPLLVQPADDRGIYRIIAGERRWRAAQEAELRRLPAFVLKRDDLGRRRVQLVENLQRVDLTAAERAQHVSLMRELVALQARTDGREVSERELDTRVGEMLGVSDRAVRDFLAAIALPAEVQDIARERRLSIKHLKAATMVAREQAPSFAEATATAGVTGDEALTAARLIRDEAMPIAQALAAAHATDTPNPTTATGAATLADGVDADAGVTGDVPAREEPRPIAPLQRQPSMPRQRRAVYVRLLEVERMLARLPLVEAAEPAEATLWVDALDAVIARATTLRTSLAHLHDAPLSSGKRRGATKSSPSLREPDA